MESDSEPEHRIEHPLDASQCPICRGDERARAQKIAREQKGEDRVRADLHLSSKSDLGGPTDRGDAKRGSEYQKAPSDAQQWMHTTIRKEGVPKGGSEELGNGDPVDAVGGKQPKLVAEAEPYALFPPIGKINPDRPAHVGNALIAPGTEPMGR